VATSDPLADAAEAVLEDNPFEEFNRAMGAGIIQDPYPAFVEMRKEGVSPADVRALMGLEPDAELAMDDMPDIWTVSSYEAVQEILRDGTRFSSKGYADVMGAVMGHTILEMDEPEHHHYRSLIQQAFTRKAMERWETELVGPVVDGFIDRFADRGRADLVRELTFPFPVTVIAALLGLPVEDLAQFHRWAIELIGVGLNYERGMAASQKLGDYFAVQLEQRRREGAGDDMISILSCAELDGHTLTDDEIFAFLRLLLPAGAETTYRSSSNLFHGLLTNPDQLDAVRRDRSLVPQAIEEGLRWEPPLLTIMRTVAEDTEVCGKTLHAGAVLVVNMGAANHDERRWKDPERFDIFREPLPHIAFAFGPHMCLGMHLARMETKVVLNAVLDRLPNVAIDPDADTPYITGMTFRAPPSLPVVFG
jgi:cytochrome P450